MNQNMLYTLNEVGHGISLSGIKLANFFRRFYTMKKIKKSVKLKAIYILIKKQFYGFWQDPGMEI